MPTKQKNKLVTVFAVTNLILFLIFFLPFYVFEVESDAEVIGYIISIVQEIGLYWLLPSSAAVYMLLLYTQNGIKKPLISAIPLALTSLIYTVPYYYLVGIIIGYDSIESLWFLLLVSFVYVTLFYAITVILFFIGKEIFIKNLAKNKIADLPPLVRQNITKKNLKDARKCAIEQSFNSFSEGKTFDLSAPSTLSLFMISFTIFLFHLIIEIYDAYTYFTQNVGNYSGDMVAYTVFRFLFILLMLFVTQAVNSFAKKRLLIPTSAESESAAGD